ncbi:MAG: GMC family oxidoreductase N-terminal domain-containing protein [Myxococcota bacterium]
MTLWSHEDTRGEVRHDVDDVIIGSGPGGAAMARVLAERGRRVMMVEQGPSKPNFRPNMAHTMRYHMQEGGSMVAMGSAPVSVAAGRGVGGGSLINSAICWRTPEHVLERWVEVLGGDNRYGPAVLTEVFDELSDLLQITQTWDGIAGENNKLIVRGAEALGLKGGLLHRNAPLCVGCGICNYGCPSGGKASVDKNLIAMARAAGAIVQGDCTVETVLIEGGRAVGVVGTVQHTDTREVVGRLTVRAKRVIVAAGAIGTPRLLHQAGLAGRLGPAVGRGLHLHPGNGVFGLCDHEVFMWRGATQGAYFEDPALPGVLPHTLNLPPGALALAMGRVGLEAKENLAMAPRMCGCLVMVSDKGEGTVGVHADGTANITYEFAPVDIDNMRKGLIRTCEVLLAGGARRLLVPVHGVGWCDTLEEARAGILGASLTDYRVLYAAHPMATCRMGVDPATSVIGPDGQAHGLAGLYIADSSIFPTALGVNPQLTTMALATVMARHLAS